MLVTGATGSGKTTTLSAILNEINEQQAVHVVTLEDPIEYIHQHKKAGTLDQFRGPDGLIQAVFMCPDDYRLYADLYRGIMAHCLLLVTGFCCRCPQR